MFGSGRDGARTRAQLFRDEMEESFDHLLRAAGYAAGGVGATVGPGIRAAREHATPAAGRVHSAAARGWESGVAAFAPLTGVARGVPRQAMAKGRKRLSVRRRNQVSRGRWSVLAALAAAGAAAGVVGALVMRRRREREWDEYAPDRSLGSVDEFVTSTADRAAGTAGESTQPAAEAADATPGDGSPARNSRSRT